MEHESDIKYTFDRDGNSVTAMWQYLRDFDPIHAKYCFPNPNDDDITLLTPGMRAHASEYESGFQFSDIIKKEYSSILDNLKLVYGNDSLVRDDIKVYHLTERKIIHEFLAIPQLDRMFSEEYFNFEWDMHVGQNFNEHRSDYYRDHFIHQIRDMYMMLVMLDKFHLGQAAEHILKTRGLSNISGYVNKRWITFWSDRRSPCRLLLSDLLEERNAELKHGEQEDEREYVEWYFYNYVIKASSILAALFHDMGYPICHFLEVRRRLSNYNPTMYMVTHNAVESFDQIASLLAPSLLFMVVSLQDIKKSLEPDEKGKFNHGAYSAIAFLMQFYNNGIIHSLSQEKQCAIELAALAIYNHTVKYSVIEGGTETPYYSLFFQQNPIAFLLRLCDDLQEWDRRYFEISDASDLMFCKNCHSPILRTPILRKTKEDDNSNCSIYECFCTHEDPQIIRPDIFMKRKLYLVTVSDRVTMKVNTEEHTLDVEIKYDLYKLLMLANINETYAKYRHKELVGLEKLIANQIYEDLGGEFTKLGFNKIRLKYFMSPNPILIKLKILENYVQYLSPDAEGIPSSIGPEVICAEVWRKEKEKADADFKRIIKTMLMFYLRLLRRCRSRNNLLKDEFSSIINGSTTGDSYQESAPQYYSTMRILIADCLKQFKKEFSNKTEPESYIDSSDEDALYRAISIYTNSENRFNQFKEIKKSAENSGPYHPYISYYFDIWVFKKMVDQMENKPEEPLQD